MVLKVFYLCNIIDWNKSFLDSAIVVLWGNSAKPTDIGIESEVIEVADI